MKRANLGSCVAGSCSRRDSERGDKYDTRDRNPHWLQLDSIPAAVHWLQYFSSVKILVTLPAVLLVLVSALGFVVRLSLPKRPWKNCWHVPYLPGSLRMNT